MPSTDPKIIDVTVREGGYLVHHRLLREQVADIARELEIAGAEYMEISHGRGIGAKKAGYPALFPDEDLLKAARGAAPKLKYSVFLRIYPYSLFELEKVAEHCELARLGINLDEVGKSADFIARVKEHKKQAVAMLQRIHRAPASEVAEAAKTLEDAGADVVYLCDDFGSMGHDDVKSYFERVGDKTKLPLGFQSHNSTGRAVDNSLAALESGAEWLDASLLGLGPMGGVTPFEVLISILQRKGLSKRFRLGDLCLAASWYALPAVRQLPRARYIDLLFSKHKIDFYPAKVLEGIADILDIEVEALLLEILEQRPNLMQMKEADLRDYLQGHKLDFDVVMEFMKTGNIPG